MSNLSDEQNELVQRIARPENRADQERAFEMLDEEAYVIYDLCDEIMDLRDKVKVDELEPCDSEVEKEKRIMVYLTGMGDTNICFVPPEYREWFFNYDVEAPDGYYEGLFARCERDSHRENKYDNPVEMRKAKEGNKPDRPRSSTWQNDRMASAMTVFDMSFCLDEAREYAEDQNFEIVETIEGQIY